VYLWEAAEKAAIKMCAACHEGGVHRMRWAPEPRSPDNPAGGALVYECIPSNDWVVCTRDEAMQHFPRAGWFVGQRMR